MLLQEIIHIIESVAPLSYQEAWDNSGLQVGNPSADIRAALLTTDLTESVVSEAISLGCNLIISHHPLLFRGVKHICGNTPQERCIIQAIRHDIALSEVLTKVGEKEGLKPASIDAKKADNAALRAWFTEVLPNWDEDRVYPSDIRKLIQWYNVLINAGITDFSVEEETAAEEEVETKD